MLLKIAGCANSIRITKKLIVGPVLGWAFVMMSLIMQKGIAKDAAAVKNSGTRVVQAQEPSRTTVNVECINLSRERNKEST